MRKLTRLFALMLALTMLLGALPALAEEPANPSGIPYYKVTSAASPVCWRRPAARRIGAVSAPIWR